MDFHTIKKGNIVSYSGSLTQYHGLRGTIRSVDQWDRECYELELQRFPYQAAEEPQIIRAYEEEVREISINDDFLTKQGFTNNEGTGLFTKGGVVIMKIIYTKNETDELGRVNRSIDNMGYRVVNEPITDYRDKSEVLSKTDSVDSVNALQNFYKEVLGEDFTPAYT